MSETAETLIKAAMRALGQLASGASPTTQEAADALEVLQFMLRTWSGNNMMLYYQEQATITMNGSSSYSCGSGGDITDRPEVILGATRDDEAVVRVIDKDKYRRLSTTSDTGDAQYIWYNPEHPLGLIYPWPTGGGTMKVDYLVALTEPGATSSNCTFPDAYYNAIKWNLAIELAPEYGVNVSPLILKLAGDTKRDIWARNFVSRLIQAKLELVRVGGNYQIDDG